MMIRVLLKTMPEKLQYSHYIYLANRKLFCCTFVYSHPGDKKTTWGENIIKMLISLTQRGFLSAPT